MKTQIYRAYGMTDTIELLRSLIANPSTRKKILERIVAVRQTEFVADDGRTIFFCFR